MEHFTLIKLYLLSNLTKICKRKKKCLLW